MPPLSPRPYTIFYGTEKKYLRGKGLPPPWLKGQHGGAGVREDLPRGPVFKHWSLCSFDVRSGRWSFVLCDKDVIHKRIGFLDREIVLVKNEIIVHWISRNLSPGEPSPRRGKTFAGGLGGPDVPLLLLESLSYPCPKPTACVLL